MIRLARRIAGSAVRPRFDETRLRDLVAGHGRAGVLARRTERPRRAAMLQLLDAVSARGVPEQRSFGAAPVQLRVNLDFFTLEYPTLDWGAPWNRH